MEREFIPMTNIAFVFTEYQQNILFAICLQQRIHIDILFIRENITLHKNANIFVRKVVYYKDVPFSWRSVWKYYRVYKMSVSPLLDRKNSYRIFTWNIENPLCRYAINFTRCKQIELFEDGSGSYMKWGLNNYNLGLKTFAISTFIHSFTNIFSLQAVPLNHSNINGWALFENCYPDFNISKKIIDHKCFQKIIEDALSKESEIANLENGATVFINSPYVEFGILSENEYTNMIIDTVKKISMHTQFPIDRIYWKLHPRTNQENEKMRLQYIHEMTNITFEVLSSEVNMELIALANNDKKLNYYSLGSSSLYIIKALVSNDTSVCLIESEILKNKAGIQMQLIEMYKLMGIRVM